MKKWDQIAVGRKSHGGAKKEGSAKFRIPKKGMRNNSRKGKQVISSRALECGSVIDGSGTR